MRALTALDTALARSRPGWAWLAECGLVVLGVHLAADRLDDPLASALQALPLPWSSPDTPWVVAASVVVALELCVAAYVVGVRALSVGAEPIDRHAWWERRSIEAVSRPLFWAVCAAAGAWVVGMSVEDALGPWLGGAAVWAGRGVALLCLARLGWTGWRAVVNGLPAADRWTRGAVWVGPIGLVTLVAARYGLPIWGWLP